MYWISSDSSEYAKIPERCFYCKNVRQDIETVLVEVDTEQGSVEKDTPTGEAWACGIGFDMFAEDCEKDTNVDKNKLNEMQVF